MKRLVMAALLLVFVQPLHAQQPKGISEYVRANYHHAGTFDTTEVYARDPLPEPKSP